MSYIKQVWGIRHLRYFYLRWRVEVWAIRWAQMGIGLGVPNQSDLDYLETIWRGEA